MAIERIKCPFCGKEALITYEEDRVYKMACRSCKNTVLHVDRGFDIAVQFFKNVGYGKPIMQVTCNQHGDHNMHITNVGTLNLEV